jgi:MFS transporter, DHA2 family, multidrug resistance protein
VTLLSFTMFGLFFALPQYFQDVRGVNSLGSGLRLLPMVLGMVIGMVIGTRLQSVRGGGDGAPGKSAAGPRSVITAGYAVIAVALGIGAFTTLSSSNWYTLAWVAVAGLGFGLVMPSAMNVTLASLTAERSGSGSALISAMRQVGSVIGVAILGTLISNAYASRVDTSGLPAAAADVVRQGVAGGVEVAAKAGDAVLLASVRSAVVSGMDIMLWTCGGIAVACALLAVVFLRKLR